MKIILEREEVDKLIMNYLQSQGKIEKGKNTSVTWNIDKSNFGKSYIEIEQYK